MIEKNVSSGTLCSTCWGMETPSHASYCKLCKKVFCEACVRGGHGGGLVCPICGQPLAQFRLSKDQSNDIGADQNELTNEEISSYESVPTWSGLSPKLVGLHRKAFEEVSFGAYVAAGIGAVICNSLARVVSPGVALVLAIFSFSCSVYQTILLWQLFARRNRHFRWHRQLEFGLLKFLRDKGGRVAVLIRLMNDAQRREFRCSNAVFILNVVFGWLGTAFFIIGAIRLAARGGRRVEEITTTLWVIAGILWAVSALFGLYIAKRLTQDFFYHEQREDDFLRSVQEELQTLGVEFSLTSRKNPLKKRHFWLYLFIYTPITFGIFLIYWMYVIFHDPHRHFYHQHLWESNLLPIAPYLAVPEASPTDAEISVFGSGMQTTEQVTLRIEDRLQQLSDLKNKGLITEEEYDIKRKMLLDEI